MMAMIYGINAPPEQAGFTAWVGHHHYMAVAPRLQAAAVAIQGNRYRIAGERLQTRGKGFITNSEIPQ